MTQPDLLKPLVDAIETVKDRIQKHEKSLGLFEARTRVSLIDPVLWALGWDVSDPGMVTPEFPVGDKRVDYALLRPGNEQAVLLEAKKLSETLRNEHRSQMTDYGNRTQVSYTALTNGDSWEVYVVNRTALEIQWRPLMNLRILDDSLHEVALKFLLLWQPNIASGQPVEAEVPIVGVPTDGVPAPQRPPVTPNDSPLPDRSAEWTPLAKAQPTNENRPIMLRLPDGREQRVRHWSRVIVRLIEWLYENGKLTSAMVPFESLTGGTIVDSTRRDRKFEQVGAYPIYVNKHGPFSTHVRRWQFLASEFGFDLNSVLVQIR